MYNMSEIMTRAWKNFRKGGVSFSEALHRAWLTAKAKSINTAQIAAAKAAAGITEVVNTWAEWRRLGYEVVHGSRALFSCTLIYGSKGDGATYKASFFSVAQVQPVSTA